MSPRILVVGCGGIGGIVAAHLSDLGAQVSVLSKNRDIAETIRARGFRIEGSTLSNAPPVPAYASPGDLDGVFDFIVLAVQPPQVVEAAQEAKGVLAPSGRMVCLQNGLCEERVGAIVGQERVLGGVVTWGATMLGPGHYERTAEGGFSIGRLDGIREPALSELASVLECVGPVTITDNLLGARWSKLALNCAVSSLGTIAGDRLGPVLAHRHARRLALEIWTEVVHVARALGVVLEKISGTVDLEWLALSDEESRASASPSLVAKHALLLAVGARYRKMRSSMLAAIERGRPCAIEFLNGEVVDRATAMGIPCPVNLAVRDEVSFIAQGGAKPSVGRLQALYDRTRPAC